MNKKSFLVLASTFLFPVVLYLCWTMGLFGFLGTKIEFVSFVRAEKIKEVTEQKIGVKGKDVLEKEFGAGIIRFWPPHEIPSHPRDPNGQFVGRYRTEIDCINGPKEFPVSFRLTKFEVSSLKPSGSSSHLYGRYYDVNKAQWREFIHPQEIIGESIDVPAGIKGIEMTIDFPKDTKSFDISFEVEVSYQDKTETIKFQDHFVRSKYVHIPID